MERQTAPELRGPPGRRRPPFPPRLLPGERTSTVAASPLATFFALTFAAGHLTQEIRDHQGDVLNAIRTNAVIFGQRRTFAASLALFTLAHALLLLLALQGILPRPLAALVALYPLHLRWSLKTLAEGLTYASIRRLQARVTARSTPSSAWPWWQPYGCGER